VAAVQYTFTQKQYTEQHTTIHGTAQKFLEEHGPCRVFTGFTLAFALQLRKKQGETSVGVAEECQLAR